MSADPAWEVTVPRASLMRLLAECYRRGWQDEPEPPSRPALGADMECLRLLAVPLGAPGQHTNSGLPS